MKRLLSFLFVPFFLLLLSCGGPVMETKLDGYDQGKRVFKMNLILNKANTADGQTGYKLNNLVHYSQGTKVNMKTERESILNKDFSLSTTFSTYKDNQKSTRTSAEVKGGKILVRHQQEGKPEVTKEIDHVGPVFIELHPLMYFSEVTPQKPSKNYPALNINMDEDKVAVTSVEVRYVGEAQFYEDNIAYNSRHYQIQAVTAPEEYDDYYLDPKTGNILKIEFGMLKFVPAGN